MPGEKALDTDLNSHITKDPRAVHGIFDLMRPYIPKYVPLDAPQEITITADNTWRDVDLSSYVASTVTMVHLQLQSVSNGGSGRWLKGWFRANGNASATGQSRVSIALDADPHGLSDYATQAWCPMVDQTLEYNIYKDAGTNKLYLLGYWKTGI